MTEQACGCTSSFWWLDKKQHLLIFYRWHVAWVLKLDSSVWRQFADFFFHFPQNVWFLNSLSELIPKKESDSQHSFIRLTTVEKELMFDLMTTEKCHSMLNYFSSVFFFKYYFISVAVFNQMCLSYILVKSSLYNTAYLTWCALQR